MHEESYERATNRRGVLAWTIVVGVLTTLVAMYAWRGSSELSSTGPSPFEETAASEQNFVLPNDPPLLPPGPHRQTFVLSCAVCHSTRLVVNQPPFPRKTWTALVHKMVMVYGAPIAAEDEPHIVEYLMTIRGSEE